MSFAYKLRPFLASAAALTALSLVPATNAAFAAIDKATERELGRFMAVFEVVRANYVDTVPADKLMDGAIRGMLTNLDAHSDYLDARDFENLRTQTQGEYGGLGLSVTMEDGAVKIIAPTADTPADRGGLKSGDYITHLNGKLIFGGSLDEAVEQMRGAPGTRITLTIVRPGRDKPFDVTLTREIIQIKPIKWKIVNGVPVVQVTSFSETTTRDLGVALRAIAARLGHQPAGYVIDLRSNPGGLLEEGIGVADTFLTHGDVVSQRGRRTSENEVYKAESMVPGDLTGGRPLIVLIDAGTASAAEIVAGALQDQHRALIMGERSFGKGSVQTVLPITATTALRLTTARYYTPSGRSVQEGGIQPDIRVPQLSDPDYKSRPRFREADLKRHLVNEKKVDTGLLETDARDDPRFAATADQLKKQGIEDFQLDYAVKALLRAQNGKEPLVGPATVIAPDRMSPSPAKPPVK